MYRAVYVLEELQRHGRSVPILEGDLMEGYV
jgi:hypothetical protein